MRESLIREQHSVAKSYQKPLELFAAYSIKLELALSALLCSVFPRQNLKIL